MAAAGELEAQRKLTKAFIAADSVTVVLMRSEYVSDGAGGWVKGDPAPLPPQVMRLIPLSDRGEGATRITADGEQVKPSYMLQGVHDADVERWDEFTLNGVRYEVVFVQQNTQYQVKAEVLYRG